MCLKCDRQRRTLINHHEQYWWPIAALILLLRICGADARTNRSKFLTFGKRTLSYCAIHLKHWKIFPNKRRIEFRARMGEQTSQRPMEGLDWDAKEMAEEEGWCGYFSIWLLDWDFFMFSLVKKLEKTQDGV